MVSLNTVKFISTYSLYFDLDLNLKGFSWHLLCFCGHVKFYNTLRILQHSAWRFTCTKNRTQNSVKCDIAEGDQLASNLAYFDTVALDTVTNIERSSGNSFSWIYSSASNL